MISKTLKPYTRDAQFKDKKPVLFFLTTIGKEDIRCVGYYISIKDARNTVRDCCESLCEVERYKYVVIEATGPGWYPSAKKEEWYEFINHGKKVKKIKKPKQYENVCNFAIG